MRSEAYGTTYVQALARNLVFLEKKLESGGEDRWRSLFQLRQQLRSGVDEALGQPGLWSAAVALLLQLFPYIDRNGLIQEWLPVYQRALALSPAESGTQYCQLLLRYGQLQRLTGNPAAAQRSHEIVLEQVAEVGDLLLVGDTHWQLASDAFVQHQYGAAADHSELAWQQYEAGGATPQQLGSALNLLGQVAYTTGRYDSATIHYQAALQQYQAVTEPTEQARIWNNLGQLHVAVKRYEEAEVAFRQAKLLLGDTPHRSLLATVLLNLGVAHINLEQYPAALLVYGEVDTVFLRRLQDYHNLAMMKQNLGMIMRALGDIPQALEYFAESLAFREHLPFNPARANTLGSLGLCKRDLGQDASAIEYFREAIQLLKNFPDDAWGCRLQQQYQAALRELGAWP